MERVIDKNLCTGCSACFDICPNKAILMKNSEGFEQPKIDKSKCIDCGLCRRTCPVINNKNNSAINECYVGYGKDDEILKDSSSGGIFSLLANYVLKNDGIVIGASFNDNMELQHIAIDNEKDLYKLKGSKYLQSKIGDVYKLVKDNINNKKVLFVGVPCQVAGLKAYLRNDYDNLFCIDLICHGVPSPKLFKKYLEELESQNNSKVIEYNFRDKSTGWDSYSNTIRLGNKTINELSSENSYMKLFLSDVALRESCYNCNFKLGNKYSDITLGDFWGVQNYYPEMYNKKGVSAIIINTDKGKNFFNKIQSKVKYKECKLEEIVSGNPSLKVSAKKDKRREEFFRDLDKKTIGELTKKNIKKTSNVKRILSKIQRCMKTAK